MRKSTYYILLLATMILLIGCKKDTTNKGGDVIRDFDESGLQDATISPSPTENPSDQEVTVVPITDVNHEGQMRSLISGLWVSEEISKKRPIAFQFNNFKTVSNQSGIGQADIVYECLVEGGITRLLGIGENYTGDRIGSTRSARHYFVSIADEYDAIYVHYGRTKYAVSKIKELGIDDMDGMDGIGSTVFYRDKSIKAPHNAFASLKGILAGIKKKGFETQYGDGYESHYSFYEEDTDLTAGSNANKVTLEFSAYASPYLVYNSTDKLYYRYQYGAIHKDAVTGKQLTFKNIIIQFVKEWDIDKNDYQTMDLADASGSGYYITNGKMVPITWKKNESSRKMRYYNESGEELTINPGKTFISLFPRDRTNDIVIED
jgi:hypothetical protein